MDRSNYKVQNAKKNANIIPRRTNFWLFFNHPNCLKDICKSSALTGCNQKTSIRRSDLFLKLKTVQSLQIDALPGIFSNSG